MKHEHRSQRLSMLLVSTSLLALAATPAAALTVGEATTEGTAFEFGDKSVFFTDFCGVCGSGEITGLDGDNIGFRIVFSGQELEVEANASQSGFGSDDDGPNGLTGALAFTVSSDPLFEIIGATLRVEAGVVASYDWDENGEDDFGGGGTGSVSARGDIDISLNNGGELASFDTEFDGTAENLAVGATEDDSDNVDTTGSAGPSGGALTPSQSQDLSILFDLDAFAECDVTALELPICSADALTFITAIEVRFIQREIIQDDVPAPGTLGLLGAGLAGLGYWRRRRRS